MTVLTAAVVLIGALCVFGLLMIFGLVRRLKEHTAILEDLLRARGKGGGAPAGTVLGAAPAPGTAIGPFATTAVDGTVMSTDSMPDRYVAVFLAADCESCRKAVPTVINWAARQDRTATLVVIDGQIVDSADLVAKLSPVAMVVVEVDGTAVADAFGLSAFPAFCVVADGKVTLASMDVQQLPVLV